MRPALVFVIACGGTPAPAPAPAGPAASPIATRASADDFEVAHVNGRPVWGSCVAAQAAHEHVTREQALDHCIGFELLAQTAEARGFARDRDVIHETRTAMVNQLVTLEFEDKFTRPIDFGDFWTKVVERNRWRYDHEEVRGSAYVRVQDEMIAKQIWAALDRERGLTAPDFKAIAEQVVAGRTKLEFSVVAPQPFMSRLDETYSKAVFSVPEVGRVSAVTHTRWGYDIVLLDSLIPKEHPTPDQLADKLLPDVKRNYFPYWVNKLGHPKIQVFDQNVENL